ncbi:MAG TPA: alpha/beta hydrolase [Solirubrobacterales bacterium]|nr:alpha/beta hydrolase [Solirubrobacterales bacterium]
MRIGPELTAPANGIELCYQELGEPDGEPMVLVMGLGGQLVHWPDGLCELLAETGFRLIRFDNRDVGRSTWIKGPPPSRTAMLLGLPRGLAYTLDDMADDLGGLIETLGIGPAHVVGASQGGMIAQVLGYRRPELVRSLGLIMTGAGKRVASVPRLRALGTLMRELPRDREAYVEAMVKAFKVIGSPDYPDDEDWLRGALGRSFDRGDNPVGAARQLHAITASGDRSRRLRAVRAPTVVIHGTRDPLVRPAGGKGLARAIPGARLELIAGMGHDLPPALWPRITKLLVENARRADVAAAPVEAAGKAA